MTGLLFKIFGSMLVGVSGLLLGAGMAKHAEEELRELDRLEMALLSLMADISYGLVPLPRALANAGERSGGKTGEVLVETGQKSGFANRKTASEALHEALSTRKAEDSIPHFVAATLEDLLKNLGTAGYREQIRYIEMSLERVRMHRTSIAGEIARRSRLYRYLGVLSAACLIIMLL